VRAILDMYAKNCEITVIGEFDEPQWFVLPEQADSDGLKAALASLGTTPISMLSSASSDSVR